MSLTPGLWLCAHLELTWEWGMGLWFFFPESTCDPSCDPGTCDLLESLKKQNNLNIWICRTGTCVPGILTCPEEPGLLGAGLDPRLSEPGASLDSRRTQMAQHSKLPTVHLTVGPSPETPHQAGKGAYRASPWMLFVCRWGNWDPRKEKHHCGSVAGSQSSISVLSQNPS